MDVRPRIDAASPHDGEGQADLKAMLRVARFPISRAELRSLAIRSGLDHRSIAAITALDDESYAGSFSILRELRHHGELRHSA